MHGFHAHFGKSGLAYEMCEHLKIVDGLNTYFPEHGLLNETVLETLGEDNSTGLKCLKEETIVKCKQLNNLSKASGKIPVAAFDNDEYIHISAFTSKVHNSARLKRFIVTYHKSEKTLDCQMLLTEDHLYTQGDGNMVFNKVQLVEILYTSYRKKQNIATLIVIVNGQKICILLEMKKH